MRQLLLVLFLLAAPASAQDVLEITQELDFDDPEAWAMKFFTSASLMTSVGPVERRDPGALELGFEALSMPHLSTEERTVGFGGFKEEDLNRAPLWARLRVTVGLPRGFSLSAGVVPPVEVDGVEATLFSLALEHAAFARGRWSVGWRVYAQVGDAEGDFTCSEGGDELFPPGSAENPFGCEGPSSDVVDLEYVGIEVVGAVDLGGGGPRGRARAPTLHFGASLNRLDMQFQVDAPTFGFRDRTKLLADGESFGLSAGATWDLPRRLRLGTELFYSPLDVLRRGAESAENDGLLNLRVLLRWQVR